MAAAPDSTVVTGAPGGEAPPPPAAGEGEQPPGDSLNDPWYSTLSEEYRDNEVVKGFESPDALVKAYLDKPAPPEPPKPEDYTLPENFNLEGFREFASESELSQKQVESALTYYGQVQEAEAKAILAVNQQQLEELLTSWGTEKDSNVNLAKRALLQFDDENKTMAGFLEQTQAGNNPFVVNFLFNAGRMLEEDGYLKSLPQDPSTRRSDADVLYPTQGKEE